MLVRLVETWSSVVNGWVWVQRAGKGNCRIVRIERYNLMRSPWSVLGCGLVCFGRDHGCHAGTASGLGGGEAGAGKHTRIPISRIHVTEDSTSQLTGSILAMNMDIPVFHLILVFTRKQQAKMAGSDGFAKPWVAVSLYKTVFSTVAQLLTLHSSKNK
jgi:hypothetical protein